MLFSIQTAQENTDISFVFTRKAWELNCFDVKFTRFHVKVHRVHNIMKASRLRLTATTAVPSFISTHSSVTMQASCTQLSESYQQNIKTI